MRRFYVPYSFALKCTKTIAEENLKIAISLITNEPTVYNKKQNNY